MVFSMRERSNSHFRIDSNQFDLSFKDEPSGINKLENFVFESVTKLTDLTELQVWAK